MLYAIRRGEHFVAGPNPDKEELMAFDAEKGDELVRWPEERAHATEATVVAVLDKCGVWVRKEKKMIRNCSACGGDHEVEVLQFDRPDGETGTTPGFFCEKSGGVEVYIIDEDPPPLPEGVVLVGEPPKPKWYESGDLPPGYYFWDETQMECCGPFWSAQEAARARDEYAASL